MQKMEEPTESSSGASSLGIDGKKVQPRMYARPSSSEPSIADFFSPILRFEMDDIRLRKLHLQEDPHTTSVLKALRKAKVQNIPYNGEVESSVCSVTLEDVKFDPYSTMPSTIYIRKFYPTLLNLLLKQTHTILTGNPGISKSWFQWYILFCMFNASEHQVKVPKVIVRQIEQEELVFMFPEHCTALKTEYVRRGLNFLQDLQPDAALLLIESDASLVEPKVTHIQTILTCSPDRRRYHEFAKKGAIKYYMPVWELDELQVVATHIRANAEDKFVRESVTPTKIMERYSRFGGIIRHVFPRSREALEDAESEQSTILARAEPAGVLIHADDIEKRDDIKDNISHFLLQYHVNRENFRHFEMVIASEHVEMKLNEGYPSDLQLQQSIDTLHLMFLGSRKTNPDLFEFAVYHMLLRNSFKWYRIDHAMVKHDIHFRFDSGRFVLQDEPDVLKIMQPRILYRPCVTNFPGVDMLWVESTQGERAYYAIQVTFAESHAKNTSVFSDLYSRLGLDKNDKLTVYFITNPRYSEKYAQHTREQFFTNPLSSDVGSYNIHFATIGVENFHVWTTHYV